MSKDQSSPSPPLVVIERLVRPGSPGWHFAVRLIHASGTQQLVWVGVTYERAILRAEEVSREHRGPYPLPLTVVDRILATPGR